MTISGGEKHYYIVANDQKLDAEEFLNKYGITAKDNTENVNTEETTKKVTEKQEENEEEEQEEKNNNNEKSEKQKIGEEIVDTWNEVKYKAKSNNWNIDKIRKELQKELRKNDENAKVTKKDNTLNITYKGYDTLVKAETVKE